MLSSLHKIYRKCTEDICMLPDTVRCTPIRHVPSPYEMSALSLFIIDCIGVKEYSSGSALSGRIIVRVMPVMVMPASAPPPEKILIYSIHLPPVDFSYTPDGPRIGVPQNTVSSGIKISLCANIKSLEQSVKDIRMFCIFGYAYLIPRLLKKSSVYLLTCSALNLAESASDAAACAAFCEDLL